MARNKFGAICDNCGFYTTFPGTFYQLRLPTYQSQINNSIQSVDYCHKCYHELKVALKDFYKIEWEWED